jgi:hypothetical protein
MGNEDEDLVPCPITISDAAPYLGRPRTTVASWARRGWYDRDGNHQTIKPVDHKGRHNAARYWLRDLQRAEYDTRESEWSQRTELAPA